MFLFVLTGIIGCSGGPCYLWDSQNKKCTYLIGVNSGANKLANKPMLATSVTHKTMELIKIAKTFEKEQQEQEAQEQEEEKEPPRKKRKIIKRKRDPYFTGDVWHPRLNQNTHNSSTNHNAVNND